MATLVVQQSPLRHSPTPPPPGSGVTLDASKFKSSAIPNKHIPYCSPGPAPSSKAPVLVTPPDSPPSAKEGGIISSLLHPPTAYDVVNKNPRVYSLGAEDLAKAIEHMATSPIPEVEQMFPWLHGLHPDNQIQTAFFMIRKSYLKRSPKGFRGITLLKAGGDLTKARLKGAISPDEVLAPTGMEDPMFYDVDPKEGFCVRNFHIQAAKMAMVSDIVIYKDDETSEQEVYTLAKRVAKAQERQLVKNSAIGIHVDEFNTFVVTGSFKDFESKHPDLIAVDSQGEFSGKVLDFFQMERHEMCVMSKASEFAHNVWLGPTPDPTMLNPDTDELPEFDVMIEASDMARAPESNHLKAVAQMSAKSRQDIEFPSSGSIMPPTWSHSEVDSLLEMCHWIYALANGEIHEEDAEGNVDMESEGSKPRKILIHCGDGYTETSLLALTYFMFAECIPVHEAWIKLHTDKQRNFFAYSSDVQLLTSIEPRILQESPLSDGGIPSALPETPMWLKQIDGSLPSRILPYMYLGNIGHANNPEMLRRLGIKRVLSVGEPVSWSRQTLKKWGEDNLMFIDRVQDNGIDPLTDEFGSCLDFIRRGKDDGTATLVHCRVGVSRSATICIAEVMSSMERSFPRAYCFVRARRLNVIVQPHLRFAYELLKWEEKQTCKRGLPLRRELEWPLIAREIAAMNKPYTRQ